MDREAFMEIVYELLKDDPDNNRANEIINAADEYAEDAVKEALEGKDTNVHTNSALDHIHNVVAENERKKGYEQAKAEYDHKLTEIRSRIKDHYYNKGYEQGKADAPGEAHWIKSYTPDDGEIYECDNCGVTWAFNDGGPEENEAYYCPKCGFKMVPKEGEENETD